VGTHMPSVDPMRCALRMPGVENRAGVVLSRPPLAMANGNVPRTVAGNVLGTVAEGADDCVADGPAADAHPPAEG